MRIMLNYVLSVNLKSVLESFWDFFDFAHPIIYSLCLQFNLRRLNRFSFFTKVNGRPEKVRTKFTSIHRQLSLGYRTSGFGSRCCCGECWTNKSTKCRSFWCKPFRSWRLNFTTWEIIWNVLFECFLFWSMRLGQIYRYSNAHWNNFEMFLAYASLINFNRAKF